MAIQGKQREGNFTEKTKKVGLWEGSVIAVNPSLEDYKEVTGVELKEESKATEYLGESKDGNTFLRVDFWLENVKSKEKEKITYFLEDKERVNKDKTKTQYINILGACSWADNESNLPSWFIKNEYRVAYNGEEEFYGFLRTWLGKIDFKSQGAELSLDWKKLMKGNTKELQDLVNSNFTTSIVVCNEIKTVDKDGEVKEYQNIYSKMVLPSYTLKQFRLVDYTKEEVISSLKGKLPKDLKVHEKFVVQITDSQYGSKNFYVLKDLREYISGENFAASDKVITEDSPDY